MKKLILFAIFSFPCLTMSSFVFALNSTCSADSQSRTAWHIVNLTWYESTIANILHVDSKLSGALNRASSHSYRDVTFLAMDIWKPPLPYGSYNLMGISRLETIELGRWEQFSGDKCSLSFTFAEPNFCETTDPVFGTPIPLIRDFSRKFEGLFNVALSSRFGTCSSKGSPQVSGTLNRMSVTQCCEKEKTNKTGEAFQGDVKLEVPGVSCKTPTISVPVFGVPGIVKVNFGGRLSGNAKGSAQGWPALCGATGVAANITGSATGTLAVSATGAIIGEELVSAAAEGSASLTARFSAPSISQISTSGCAGPIRLTGTVSLGGSEGLEREFGTEIPNSTFCF